MRQPHRAQALCFVSPYRPCSAGRSSQASPTRSRVRISVLARRRRGRRPACPTERFRLSRRHHYRQRHNIQARRRRFLLAQDRRPPGSRRSRCRRHRAERRCRPAHSARAWRRPTPGAPGAGPAPPDAQPPAPAAQPDDTVITEMPTQKIENTRAVFAGLDKITGRIISFDAAIGETVQFGALQGNRARLLHAPADRSHQHGRLRRSRRSDPAGRDQAHL